MIELSILVLPKPHVQLPNLLQVRILLTIKTNGVTNFSKYTGKNDSWSSLLGLIGCIGVKCHFTAMAVGDAYVFPGFLTPVLTHIYFQSHLSKGERRKYAGEKFRLNRVSNSQPPGHESDTLITEQPGRGKSVPPGWDFLSTV